MNLLTIPAAWTGHELLNSQYWNYQLSREEVAEIEKVIHLSGSSDRNSIKLAQLRETFKAVSEELENGRGAVLLKGFPVQHYSEAELADAYLMLCQHMGLPIRQSNSDFDSSLREKSQFVTYIRAEAPSSSEDGKQSNDAYKFHTDRYDVLSLLCVRQAQTGGENRLASAIAIYNEMVQSNPDIVKDLFRDLPWFFEGENSWIGYPLWCIHQGKFTTQLSSTYARLSQLLPDAPRLTENQKKGLELLEATGIKLGITLRLEPGDWLMVNNHVVYHARSSWKIESGEWERLLLRVCYSPFNSRELPDTPAFRTIWGSVEAGKPRGGFLPNHQVSPDQAISEPLSGPEAYWLDRYLKVRWMGVEQR